MSDQVIDGADFVRRLQRPTPSRPRHQEGPWSVTVEKEMDGLRVITQGGVSLRAPITKES